MPNNLSPVLLVAGCLLCAGRADAVEPAGAAGLPAKFQRLLPLHPKMGKPQEGDWILHHPEPGQNYLQYVRSRPVTPKGKRRTIYVQPLGNFTPTQREIIDSTAEFMGIYFGLPVKIRKDLPLEIIPAAARRKHPSWGMDQILTTYVLQSVLRPRLPNDATAYIALTTSDLWPGEGWNYLFGQASLNHRVGVWSVYRNGDPEASDEAFRLCLLRTVKTATHETSHMFSMHHCIQYECNMCGCNNRAESDRRPLALCPHCLAKLCWATKADPNKRFRRLAAFCKQHGLKEEQEFYEKSLGAMSR